jgi:AcrR family transcriptional regulator
MGIAERREREKESRRQLIQNAAKELLAIKGFSLTTIEDIANRSELSPATIYLYFKNKEELYGSLNLTVCQSMYDEIEKVFENKDLDAEDKILAIKDAYLIVFEREPLLMRNIIRFQLVDDLSNLSGDLFNQMNKVIRNTMNMVAKIYENGVLQGKFIDIKGIVAGDMIWGIFTGIVIWEEAKRQIDPRKNFLKTTLDKIFDIFLEGIRKKV